ncbi:hypothetical protein RIF29_10120 [Crotalaria pallida]|uniref:Reverse transcriptase zinc-binding domain-containing protein n=1 Tax=Crotalaria pallida TaxID=3830 RepID=A0AAN9FYN9_CROPI
MVTLSWQCCARCGGEFETQMHALWNCPFAQMVWMEAGLVDAVKPMGEGAVVDWFVGMCAGKSKDDVAWLMIIFIDFDISNASLKSSRIL